MKIKGKTKYKLAVMLSSARSKNAPITITQIMLMNKKEFLKLLKSYYNFLEAEEAMGDYTP